SDGTFTAVVCVQDDDSSTGCRSFQATVSSPVSAGDVLISQFRLRGPQGAKDEFIELYNNTNADITVGGAGWTLGQVDGAGNPATIATIPNGTLLRARGYFLIVNDATPATGFSL